MLYDLGCSDTVLYANIFHCWDLRLEGTGDQLRAEWNGPPEVSNCVVSKAWWGLWTCKWALDVVEGQGVSSLHFCAKSREVSLQHFHLGIMVCQEKAKPLAGFFLPLCVLHGGCPLAVPSSQGCSHCLRGHQKVSGRHDAEPPAGGILSAVSSNLQLEWYWTDLANDERGLRGSIQLSHHSLCISFGSKFILWTK